MTKYDPLGRFLEAGKGCELQMTFKNVEEVVGFTLPRSARKHRAWWANPNDRSHPHAQGWMRHGFKTCEVDMASERLSFKKVL